MITVKDLMANNCQSSPDENYWEPCLPQYLSWRIRLRDAWAVLKGDAAAVRQTKKEDIAFSQGHDAGWKSAIALHKALAKHRPLDESECGR